MTQTEACESGPGTHLGVIRCHIGPDLGTFGAVEFWFSARCIDATKSRSSAHIDYIWPSRRSLPPYTNNLRFSLSSHLLFVNYKLDMKGSALRNLSIESHFVPVACCTVGISAHSLSPMQIRWSLSFSFIGEIRYLIARQFALNSQTWDPFASLAQKWRVLSLVGFLG